MDTSVRKILTTLTVWSVAAGVAGRTAMVGMEYFLFGTMPTTDFGELDTVAAEAYTLFGHFGSLPLPKLPHVDLPLAALIFATMIVVGFTVLLNQRASAEHAVRRRREQRMSRPNAQLRASNFRFRSAGVAR